MIKITHEISPKESIISIWLRRSISIPLYFSLFFLCLGLMPLWLLLTIALDKLKTRPHLYPYTRTCLALIMYLGCEVLGIIAAFSISVFTVCGFLIVRKRYLDLNATLQRIWSNTLFNGIKFIFSLEFEVEGLDSLSVGPYLFFVRHASVLDTLLVAAIVANPNRMLLRYIIKSELLWDPCVDVVGRRLPNAFVNRKFSDANQTAMTIESILQLADNLTSNDAILIYPEGTRFQPDKLQRAVSKLHQQASKELTEIAKKYRRVLPPRLGGPIALLNKASNVDVVIFEHTGFDDIRSLTHLFNGALVNKTIHIRIRRIKSSNIPKVHRDIWLFQQWSEIDRWIQSLD